MIPSSVAQVQKKCRKNIQNENTKYIFYLFAFIFKREILTDVYRAAVTLFNFNRRDGLIILCCIIGYGVISVSKGSNK